MNHLQLRWFWIDWRESRGGKEVPFRRLGRHLCTQMVEVQENTMAHLFLNPQSVMAHGFANILIKPVRGWPGAVYFGNGTTAAPL